MLVGTEPTGAGSMDGYGSEARFRSPWGIAVDAAGMVYVADSQNFTIRRIASDGLVRTWAGMPGQSGYADGANTEARFGGVSITRGIGGVAIEASGNLLVADRGNHRIRRMTPQGEVTTVAGGGSSITGDGPGSTARFSQPYAIATDPLGNAYVAEYEKGWIRRIAANGDVSTMAGAAEYGVVDGPLASARFGSIGGLAADGLGNVYVADWGNKTIRRVGIDGMVTTIAGRAGVTGTADGTGIGATFTQPGSLAIGADGTLYLTDNRLLRRVTPGGVVTTIATLAQYVLSLAISPIGEIYATSDNNTVLRITPAGSVTVLAGSLASPQSAVDGNAATARFASLSAMMVDTRGNLVVLDYDSIRRVAPDGAVTTLAAGVASFASAGFAMDEQGAIYFSTFLHCALRYMSDCVQRGNVRKLGLDGRVTTVAPASSSDGTPLDFRRIGGLTGDRSGNLFITDEDAGRVLKLEPSGNLTTVSRALASPFSVVANASGILYVWDQATRSLYTIDNNGVHKPIFSPPEAYPQNDLALAIDDAGNIYAADSTHHTVTKLSPTGAVLDVIGQRGRQGFEPGFLPGFLDAPTAVAVRGSDLFIAMSTGIAVVRNRP